MPAALAEIRGLQIDLIDLLFLFRDNGTKTNGKQEEDDEVDDGRGNIGSSP